jgi:hypothetical protein
MLKLDKLCYAPDVTRFPHLFPAKKSFHVVYRQRREMSQLALNICLRTDQQIFCKRITCVLRGLRYRRRLMGRIVRRAMRESRLFGRRLSVVSVRSTARKMLCIWHIRDYLYR